MTPAQFTEWVNAIAPVVAFAVAVCFVGVVLWVAIKQVGDADD